MQAGPAPGQFLATGDPIPEYTGEFRNAHSFDTFEQANSFCDAQDDNVVVAVPAKADVLVTNADAAAFDEQFLDDRIGPRDEEGCFDESDTDAGAWIELRRAALDHREEP